MTTSRFNLFLLAGNVTVHPCSALLKGNLIRAVLSILNKTLRICVVVFMLLLARIQTHM